MKALIIDTDPLSAKRIAKLFKQGWSEAAVVYTASGKEGAGLVRKEWPDIVVLDVVLRNTDDGLDILCSIRSFSNIPLIIFTYLSAKEWLVKVLNLGADAYISKLAPPEEILAVIKAVLRRSATSATPKPEKQVTCGNLTIDFTAHSITIDGKEIHLTFHEFKLLRCLARNERRTVTYLELLKNCWGPEYSNDDCHTVVVHISRLRKKIKVNHGNPGLIVTVPTIGYKFQRCP